MSEGTTSGVNWTRLNRRSMALLKASARVVFPTPGMSSSRMWPPATITASTLRIMSSLPRMAFPTSLQIARLFSLISILSAFLHK